jgi:nucleoside-diphosphate-sugar epimerase
MPDISKITASTGWTPQVNLDDGLTQTITYFKDQLVNV